VPKKRSVAAEITEVVLRSELGQTLNEGLRRVFGLYKAPQVGAKMQDEARRAGDKIRDQMRNDPYRVLGVDRQADIVVIKAAYKSLAKKYHENGTEPNADMMKRVNLAYEAIMRERGEPK
jgi:hypothetical protein